ncbi:MAG: hypothetical protein WCI49_03945 [Ferruginibacter sp.]
MKIEHLLVQHFYNTKQVTLQGVGTFTLSPDFIMPADNDKDLSIPPGAISFIFNPKATEDDSLINFIVQQTRKIKPLASADLESYLMLASQFLNIGKPFKIDGIGMLEKNQSGEFTFKQEGQFMTSLKEQIHLQVREKSGDDISFTSKSKTSGNNNNKKIAGILGLLVIAAGFVIGGFYLATKSKTEPVNLITPVTEPTSIKIIDTIRKDSTPVVTQNTVPDHATVTGAYTFKIVFKVTNNKAAAIDKMNTLVYRGHKVIMYTADSVTYKLAEPFTLPLSDTSKIKDSLNRFYYLGKAKVEL